jgi:hypothetical protein
MKQFLTLFLIYIIISVFNWNCNTDSTSKNYNEFAIYSTSETFDSLNNSYKLVPIVDHYISIQNEDDLLKTLNILLFLIVLVITLPGMIFFKDLRVEKKLVLF